MIIITLKGHNVVHYMSKAENQQFKRVCLVHLLIFQRPLTTKYRLRLVKIRFKIWKKINRINFLQNVFYYEEDA